MRDAAGWDDIMKTYETLAEVKADHETAGLHWFETAPHATSAIVGDLNRSRFVISRGMDEFDIWALGAHPFRTLADGAKAPTLFHLGSEPTLDAAAGYVRDAKLPADLIVTVDQLPSSEQDR